MAEQKQLPAVVGRSRWSSAAGFQVSLLALGGFAWAVVCGGLIGWRAGRMVPVEAIRYE